MKQQTLCAVILFVGGFVASAAHAAATAEQKCQAERAKAAGAYALCQQQAQAKLQTTKFENFDFQKFWAAGSKCRVKYTGTWAKLQGKRALAGSSCIGARFTDNGTTVTDNLTGLQWEKKTTLDSTPNFADRHDADNSYTWCIDGNSDFVCDNANAADGTAFTDFLRSLNSGGCFAGQCDWRLPTRDELQTILADAFTGSPCTTPSCIDAIFGPTQMLFYWSDTTTAGDPGGAWIVHFGSGDVDLGGKAAAGIDVRGVRGGL